MKISVIVPVFNTEKYLEKCLTSLVNQTFEDLEIICVNDGSTDNSLKVLEKFAQADSRIKIISQQNQGLSGARNTGIREASGEYIGFVDSDDWVDLNFFEKLHNAVVETSADIACASIVRERKFFKKFRVNYKEQKTYYELEDRVKTAGIPKSSYVWNKIYKTDVIKNISFKEGVYFEDMIWTPQVLLNTNSMATVEGAKYHYRVNSASIVKSKPSDKKQSDYYNGQKEVVKFFEDNNIRLTEKEKHVTKLRKYWGKLLVLKIKEYKYTEIYCLFGFIPIFRVTRYPNLEGYNG